MTSREEIERLLQMTGRTLKWLPEDYGDKKLELWNSFRDKTFGHIKSFDMANRIIHQSDVIELLVGALRDALDKPKNRPFTKEEIEDSVYVIPCVIEEKKFGLMKSDILKCSQIDNRYYGMYEALTSIVTRSKYDIKEYGKTWRCWASRPTDEERKVAQWEE